MIAILRPCLMPLSIQTFKNPGYYAYYNTWKSNNTPALIQQIRAEFEKTAFGSDPNASLLSVGRSQAYFVWIPEHQNTQLIDGLCCIDLFTDRLILKADYYRYSEGIKPESSKKTPTPVIFRNYLKPLFKIKPPNYLAGPNLGNVFFECCTQNSKVEWIKITANYYPNEEHLRFEKLIEFCFT